MNQLLSEKPTSWLFKAGECLLASIGILSILLVLIEMLLLPLLENAVPFLNQYENYGVVAVALLALIGGLVYAWHWHQQERQAPFPSSKRHAWLQAIIRYWLAFSISTYGFAKLLKTQFDTPTYRLDMPLGELNDMALTWYYFGHSYALATSIALVQLGGSSLLLFRRTTLLGVMLLLPVMTNIVLINLLMSIGTGAFFNSVVFTLALVFLLLLDSDKLKQAYWDITERLPTISLGGSWTKQGLRVLTLLGAFAVVAYASSLVKDEKTLAGTWQVERFTRNGRLLPADAWLTDSTAWKRVYFAGWHGCSFSPNPYRYQPKECFLGEYQFDSTTNQLQIVFFRDQDRIKDTLRALVYNRSSNAMRLQGVLRRDTLEMQLARLR